MIIATYVAQVACLAIGLAAGIAGLAALFDGRFVTGSALLLTSFAFTFGEYGSRQLRVWLAERNRAG